MYEWRKPPSAVTLLTQESDGLAALGHLIVQFLLGCLSHILLVCRFLHLRLFLRLVDSYVVFLE